MSRQERRIKLKQSMDAVARRGVDLSANTNDQQWAVIAATRVLVDVLDSRNPARAGNAAKRAHEFFETSLKTNPSKQAIACVKGCAFCCHVSVTATAPEVFLVANALREKYKDDFQTIQYGARAEADSLRAARRQCLLHLHVAAGGLPRLRLHLGQSLRTRLQRRVQCADRYAK
jgi:hypothetical protein